MFNKKFLDDRANLFLSLMVGQQTILHMCKHDHYMTKENNQKIHAALIGKFNIAIYNYQAGCGFANSKKLKNFNPEARTLSFQRTFSLLDSLK